MVADQAPGVPSGAVYAGDRCRRSWRSGLRWPCCSPSVCGVPVLGVTRLSCLERRMRAEHQDRAV